ELDAVLLEDAGLGAELRDRGVPVAALADRQLELVVGERRGRGEGGDGEYEACQTRHVETPYFLLHFCRIVSRPPSRPTSALAPIASTNSTISIAYMRGMSNRL